MPEGGLKGKLHLGLGNPTRMHHGSTLATLNRLPKHLWGLNTTHLLWSYRKRFRSGSLQHSTALEKEGCSHSWESQYWKGAHRWPAHGFGIQGEGCLPHSKHRKVAGKFGKQGMGYIPFVPTMQNSSSLFFFFLLAVFH